MVVVLVEIQKQTEFKMEFILKLVISFRKLVAKKCVHFFCRKLHPLVPNQDHGSSWSPSQQPPGETQESTQDNSPVHHWTHTPFAQTQGQFRVSNYPNVHVSQHRQDDKREPALANHSPCVTLPQFYISSGELYLFPVYKMHIVCIFSREKC